MGFFSKLFNSTPETTLTKDDVHIDMHSHFLPGIDDGSESLGQSIELIKQATSLGIKSFVFTPHIMNDCYKNSYQTIKPVFDALNSELSKQNIAVKTEFAAEYYLDEWFIEQVQHNIDSLLTFGDRYILIETSFMNKPNQLENIFFTLLSKGFKPILAHPERYTYAYNDFSIYDDWISRGILLQLNTISITGYYSPMAKKAAKYLIENKMISFTGTDCHGARHLDNLEKAKKLPLYAQLINTNNLLNNTLL